MVDEEREKILDDSESRLFFIAGNADDDHHDVQYIHDVMMMPDIQNASSETLSNDELHKALEEFRKMNTQYESEMKEYKKMYGDKQWKEKKVCSACIDGKLLEVGETCLDCHRKKIDEKAMLNSMLVGLV